MNIREVIVISRLGEPFVLNYGLKSMLIVSS